MRTSRRGLSHEQVRKRLERLRPDVELEEPVHARLEYLTFWIAGEECALPVARAREITRCQSITRVPTTPPWLRGVTSVRGSVVPVVDLAPRIGAPQTTLNARAAVVLVDVAWTGEPIGIGLLVEQMGRVVGVDAADVKPTPTFGTRLDARMLGGMIATDDRFVLVLDADRALGPETLLPPNETVGAGESGPGRGRSGGDRWGSL